MAMPTKPTYEFAGNITDRVCSLLLIYVNLHWKWLACGSTEQWQLLTTIIVNLVLLWNISSCRCWKQNSELKKHCFGDLHVIRSIYLNPTLSTLVKRRCYHAMPLVSSSARQALSVIMPRFCPDCITTGNKGLLRHLHSKQVSMLMRAWVPIGRKLSAQNVAKGGANVSCLWPYKTWPVSQV